MASAIVEEHLTICIKARLQNAPIKKNKNPVEDMFRGGGPLGDFSNKIDLAYLLGAISSEAAEELHNICRVRNAFAHQFGLVDFKDQKVAHLCANLKIFEKCRITMTRADEEDTATIAVVLGKSAKEAAGEDVVDLLSREKLDTARGRFTAACQFYIAAFSIIVHNVGAPPKPRF